MKKIIPAILFVSLIVFAPYTAGQTSTANEEAQGRAIWEKLQARQSSCGDLKDNDFDLLGEYFMGLMAGSSHPAMNQMMVNMMGEQGEKQMHIVLGQRLSGCDPNAAYPSQGYGFMPMMNLVPGGNNMMGNFDNWSWPMMMAGFGWFSWLFILIWWILIIFIAILILRWLVGGFRIGSRSALNILKKRYARGDISREEFEEKKKDLA